MHRSSSFSAHLRPVARLLGAAALMLVVASPAPADARRKRKRSKSKPQYVILDNVRERVNWNDGDTFKILEGPRKGQSARLAGYNTLESYGPVHFWGGFHAYQLYDIAKQGQKLAKSEAWECSSLGDKDGYGRIIVYCPKLVEKILAEGLAHVFAVGSDPNPKHVAIQLEAQKLRKGMWKWGIPARIVTSLHSVSENPDKKKSYNRVCDTQTGRSWTVEHTATFKPCDAWCHGGSCMVYVPFEVRYGDKRPECMRKGRSNRMTVPKHLGYPLKDKW